MLSAKWWASACLALLMASGVVVAQDTVTIPTEYGKLIQSQGAVGTLGNDLFGDQVGLYSGSLEFVQTDVGISDNNALPVMAGRRFVPNQGFNPVGQFGDWDLEIPHLHGVFQKSRLWTVPVNAGEPGLAAYLRCSKFGAPPAVPGESGGGIFAANEYWQGNFLYLPGAGDEEILRKSAGTATPSDGNTYPLVTRSGTAIRCLASLAGTSAGQGEGFEVVTSDGVRYRFDQLASRLAPTLTKPNPAPDFLSTSSTDTQPMVALDYIIHRQEVWILPTLVTDRFGNTVSYTWSTTNPWQLSKIAGSDGRVLTFTYVAGSNRIATISDGTKTWSYTYAGSGTNYRLSQVTQPDSRKWTFSLEPLRFMSEYVMGGGCGDSGSSSTGPLTGSMTHPSGAQGSFTVSPVKQGRSWVVLTCVGMDGLSPGHTDRPAEYIKPSLTKKVLQGPGLPAAGASWTYAYGPANNCYQAGGPWPTVGVRCTTSSPTTRTVTVTDPAGAMTRYTFGNRYQVDESQLLKVEASLSGSTALRTTVYTYGDPGAGPYPNPVGTSAQTRGDTYMTTRHMPRRQADVTEAGTTFTWKVATGCSGVPYCFDTFARPTRIVRSSTLATSRTEVITYHDNPSKWVLGQVASVKCTASVPASTACDGDVVAQTTYDATYALPTQTKAFGKVRQTLAYDTSSSVASGQRGTLKTVKDGNNHVTTYANWKRGIPQTITFPATDDQPTAVTRKAVVNDSGWITSINDENNSKTCYDYDAMGRLTGITYPSEAAANTCNTSSWAKTTQSFAPVAAAEYGIPAGHWKQTVSTGNGRQVTYFDALWRPLVTERYDNANAAATRSVVVTRYDAAGRPAFESYPMASLSSYTSTSLKGSKATYDALDRVTKLEQDSELGVLTTTTAYQSGLKTKVTNPRGKATTTTYMAYDQPTLDWPVAIAQSGGVYTDIDRDPFGKPTAITRRNSAGTVGLTRSYTYNANQELCRQVEPETGATLMGYDGAGNLTWSAAGLAASTACHATGNTSTILARRVDRAYDARNRLLAVTFPDHVGDTSYAYTPDSLQASVTADNGGTAQVTTEYTYNRRRLLTDEELFWNTKDYHIGYVYNANGHVKTYKPHNGSVSYAPNALGQPTKIGAYATGISYHPNGAVKAFTYGNGVKHTLTQTVRGLPETNCDFKTSSCTASAIVRDHTIYDENGNVAAIDDQRSSHRGDRVMTYDALDRLTKVESTMFGTATYTYDVLDNLTRAKLTGGNQVRDHYYCYDASNRLTNVKTGGCSGSTVMGLGYDVQGNVSNRNGVAYTFDYGNRLRQVGTSPVSRYVYDGQGRRIRDATSSTVYTLYNRAGQLVYTDDNRRKNQTYYLYLGDRLIALHEKPDGGVYANRYQHTDALGSAVAMTNDAGTVVETREYEPYGRQLTPTPQDGPGYTGHVYDAATGMVYMQQRYCDPMIGRCLSVDPVTAYGSGDMRFLNRYAYAFNNPYKFNDPDGRCPACDRFGDQFKRDAEAGNLKVYEPFERPALLITAGMLAAPVLVEGGMYMLANPGSVATATNVVAEVAGVTGLARYGPLNPGPLAREIADTFRGASYTGRTLQADTTLYRVISDKGNPIGKFWTFVKPQGPLQSVIDSALDQNWGNTAARVITADVPAGTRIYEGAAAAQRGLVGGGNQIYIPRVDEKWIRQP